MLNCVCSNFIMTLYSNMLNSISFIEVSNFPECNQNFDGLMRRIIILKIKKILQMLIRKIVLGKFF